MPGRLASTKWRREGRGGKQGILRCFGAFSLLLDPKMVPHPFLIQKQLRAGSKGWRGSVCL